MDFIQAIVLGIVQGLTEFLPVSSSGHLVIFQKLLGLREHSLIFDIAAHLGTLASVITVYFQFLKGTTAGAFKGIDKKIINDDLKIILFVVAATIPTALIGLSLKSTFEALFSNMTAVGFCLGITGFLLWSTRNKTASTSKNLSGNFTRLGEGALQSLSYKKAIIIGIAQAGAIAPGISRSGTTIAVALLLGLPSNLAALFSFMLAIPAILGAGVLQLKDISTFDSHVLRTLGVGFVVSYLAGLVGLYGVLHFVKRGRLEVFSPYLWILCLVCLYWSFQG